MRADAKKRSWGPEEAWSPSGGEGCGVGRATMAGAVGARLIATADGRQRHLNLVAGIGKARERRIIRAGG